MQTYIYTYSSGVKLLEYCALTMKTNLTRLPGVRDSVDLKKDL